MKKLFKTKVVAIILATTLLSNNNAYGWEFGTNILNPIKTFFTASTNPILKATPGIISNAKETLRNLRSNNKILQSAYNKMWIPNRIINKLGETTIDMTSKEQTISGAKECITEYKNATNGVINFIKEFGTRNWRRLFLKSEYTIHDSISSNGLTSNGAKYLSDGSEYLTEITKSQRLNLANFEKCIANVPGNQDIINKPWFQKLIANKNIINNQASAAFIENIKYHIRGLLETITPDNPYLKYALITALTIGSIETIYALTYGIIKRDLRRGIMNVLRFNMLIPRLIYNKLASRKQNQGQNQDQGQNQIQNQDQGQRQGQGQGVEINFNLAHPIDPNRNPDDAQD